MEPAPSALEVLAANPQARGVLFDQPHVVGGAGDQLRAAGVEPRCVLVGGDVFETVPPGGGGCLLKRIVRDWDDRRALAILRTCRRAMAPEAQPLVIDPVLAPANVPDPAKFFDLTMLLMTGGQERTADEFGALFAAAGLRLTRVIPIPAGVSRVEGAPA